MRGAVGWNGRLNGIRLDVFDSAETQKGEVFFFGGITLCRSLEEAQRVALGGYLPEGAVRSYREYLGLIPPLPPPTGSLLRVRRAMSWTWMRCSWS